MLQITIEATELIVKYHNIPEDLRETFFRVIKRCKGIKSEKATGLTLILSGEPQHLYACLFNLAIIFDIELW